MTGDVMTAPTGYELLLTAPVVVMGVSGVGKTTIASLLAEQLTRSFVDADDLHSEANVAKMSAGTPLNDQDREPWLHAVGAALLAPDRPIIACSALKRRYRDVLRSHAPGVQFIMLDAELDRLEQQISGREGHYMPTALLRSQIETLEALEEDEAGMIVTVDASPEDIVERVLS